MGKSIYTIVFASILVACSHASPYFVELDPLSMQRTVPKHGEGKHYFFKSRHRFTSNDNTGKKEQYYRDVEAHIKESFASEDNCEIIKETLSYYSEGGSVSILVVCRGT